MVEQIHLPCLPLCPGGSSVWPYLCTGTSVGGVNSFRILSWDSLTSGSMSPYLMARLPQEIHALLQFLGPSRYCRSGNRCCGWGIVPGRGDPSLFPLGFDPVRVFQVIHWISGVIDLPCSPRFLERSVLKLPRRLLSSDVCTEWPSHIASRRIRRLRYWSLRGTTAPRRSPPLCGFHFAPGRPLFSCGLRVLPAVRANSFSGPHQLALA